MTRKDDDIEPSPFDYGYHPSFKELVTEECASCGTAVPVAEAENNKCVACYEEQDVVRKTTVCGLKETGKYCVLAHGHKGEHMCIPERRDKDATDTSVQH